jgi:oxygen-independent coproporphyrinogen III oxidase
MTGLYIHVPLCAKKCGYCDFYSLPGKEALIPEYLEAIRIEAGKYHREEADTLYIGGGTPSLLGGKNLSALLSILYQTLDLRKMTEATIEVNPDSANFEFLSKAKAKGINRVSIGVQSLIDSELQAAGRIHNARQAQAAVMEAHRAGFENISADIIIGLPGQDWQSLKFSLEFLTGLSIQHLSAYCLSVEPGTPFADKLPEGLPSDNAQAELYAQAVDFLDRRGFVHYEISNFAQPGFECTHNLNYWRGGEYIGLGPAAASHFKKMRYKNKADLEAYLKFPLKQVTEEETLEPAKKAAEEAMLRLRLLEEGLDIDEMAKKFGEENVTALSGRLVKLTADGLLNRQGSIYKMPAEKALVSNPILCRVIGD